MSHRVYVDASIYSLQNGGGVSNYVTELLRRLPRFDVSVEMIDRPDRSFPLPDVGPIPVHGGPTSVGSLLCRSDRLGRGLTRWFRRRLATLMRRRPGVHLAPYYEQSPWTGVPSVVTVHDLIYEKLPEYFSTPSDAAFRVRRRRVINDADRIIAVSEHTRKDLREVYAIEPDRIDVVHLAADREIWRPLNATSADAIRRRNGLPEGFLVYVGSRAAYKNFDFVLRCLARMSDPPPMVVVGGSWSTAEVERIESEQASHRVIQIDPLPVDGLAALVASADALVYPSLYEGFGLPPLEAMACGTPVLAADAASIPEVCGGAALYFDPTDETSFVEAVETLRSSDRREIVARGFTRAGHFDWTTTAARTAEILKEVAGHPFESPAVSQ